MSKKKKENLIGKKFEAIHKSRELTVQFLFSLDIYPEQDFNQALELFLNIDELALNITPEIKERCKNLASQVWERKNEIDSVLLRVVTGWRPDRMLCVDRTILRLLILEGFILQTLPAKSAMAEATRLANDFGTKESARFVGGVMNKIAKFFEEEKEGDLTNGS